MAAELGVVVSEPVQFSRAEARRIAVGAQLLTAQRPTSLVGVVEDLVGVQIDPIAAVAPSADLVSWSRLGEAYAPSDLTFALESERSLVELGSFVRYVGDLGPLLAVSPTDVHPTAVAWVSANASFREDVLARLTADGPLTAGEIDDTCLVPWASSGWTNDKNVLRMLELLVRLGDVAIAGRRGKLRVFDLACRVYPPGLVVPPLEEARAELAARELAALGIARRGPGVACRVEDVPGTWVVDPEALELLTAGPAAFEGRCALLSPYDRLVYDRERALELFDFEYVLEMYKPAAQRRWGYYALPILYGDRLVGKLDAKADRKAGVLRVMAVHEDPTATGGPWTPEIADAVEAEIDALASWLGLEVVGG